LDLLSTVIMYLSLAGLLAGVFTAKFISVEMMGVIQVAFLGLMIMVHIQPILATLTHMSYVNGINSLFDNLKMASASVLPNRLTALQYQAQLTYSFNYTFVLLVLPMIIGLVLFIVSKIWKSKQQLLQRLSLLAVCEYGMTAVMFLLNHIIVSIIIFAIYFKDTTAKLFPISVVEASVSIVVVIAVAVLFKYKPLYFGDYKTAFKPDMYSQYHYLVLMIGRILLSIILVFASEMKYVGFISAALPLILTVMLVVKRPYHHLYNNVRAIFNESLMIVILCIYGYYKAVVTDSE
jgi:hypothetical protein